jgi:ribosome-associated toxin RatA of RatAB toxin-antitoxin module
MRNRASKILIVDGDDAFRGSLRIFIQGLGHQVFEAITGPDAIDKATNIRPDLIMMDVRLPGMNGDEVTVKLGLSSGLTRTSFTTRNRMVPDRSVTMNLVEGPFDLLDGRWDFTPIRDAGTRADLHVRFATHGVIGTIVLGPAFEAICSHLVDAFARRARLVFRGD